MTKDEAVQAMREGKKVTHDYFDEHEYVMMEDGGIVDEKGYSLLWNKFWEYRAGGVWQTGWSLYQLENTALKDALIERAPAVSNAAGESPEDFLHEYLNVKIRMSGNFWNQLKEITPLIIDAMRAYKNQGNAGYQSIPANGYTREQMESYGKEVLKSIAETFASNKHRADTIDDEVVFQAISETITNFPLPPLPAQEGKSEWVNALEVIPEMINPLGRYWPQPNRKDILLTDKLAKVSEENLKLLKEYSVTEPSGVYEGKMWQSIFGGKRYLRWYGKGKTENTCSINEREILPIN